MISDLNAAMSLQNYGSQFLHLFELRQPFLMHIATCDRKNGECSFYQFSFDGQFRHILDEQELNSFFKRPPHQHSFIEIMYVLSGEVTNHIEDKTFTYHAGDCVIMNRNIHHKEEGDYQAVLFGLQENFINDLIEEEVEQYQKVPDNYHHFLQSPIIKMLREAPSDHSQFQKIYLDCFSVVTPNIVLNQVQPIFNDMIAELSSQTPGSLYIVKGLMQKFLFILCDPVKYNVSSMCSTLSKKRFLIKKIEHLLESTHGKISCSELAEQLHYSEDYLNRIIKQSTGKTFSQYRRDIMLHEAKRLLLETDMSVSKIMEQLELSNKTFFYQIFQKEFGLTPSEYRQQNSSRLIRKAAE